MRDPDISDEIVLAAFKTFWSQKLHGEGDAGNAFFDFCQKITGREPSPDRVNGFLNDPDQIAGFTGEFKRKLTERRRAETKEQSDELLQKIYANTEQLLEIQQGMHTEITRLNAISTRVHLASHENSLSAAALTKDVNAVNEHVEAIRSNTSFWSTFLSGLVIGAVSGVASSYYYERNLSVSALAAKAAASAPPPFYRVEPWPPTGDLMELFRSNDAYMFKPPALAETPQRNDKTLLSPEHTPRLENRR